MQDSHVHSLIKAVSWRMLGTLATMLIVFLFTGQWAVSFYVGILEMTTKIALFYLHERLWLVIKPKKLLINPHGSSK